MITALGIRSVHVAQGITCLATARSAYRRPRLALGAVVVSGVELAWLVKRSGRVRARDPLAARVDAIVGLAGLAALGAATEPDDRTSSLNWMLPLTVGSCINALRGVEVTEGMLIASGLSGAYLVTTRDALRSGSGRAATAIANAMSYPAFFLLAAIATRVARRLARELDVARAEAVEQSARAGAEAARNQAHRIMHDSAIQTLEAVGSRFDGVTAEVRRVALREAAQLRRSISESTTGTGGLMLALDELAAEFAARGLHVTVTSELASEPDVALCGALRDATREALTNVVKHAEVDSAVVRAVVTEDGDTRITVRDQGRGFEPSSVESGFGLTHSIRGRIHEVGGTVSISSAPGRGTRVELEVRG